jgi:hypothetical protein
MAAGEDLPHKDRNQDEAKIKPHGRFSTIRAAPDALYGTEAGHPTPLPAERLRLPGSAIHATEGPCCQERGGRV